MCGPACGVGHVQWVPVMWKSLLKLEVWDTEQDLSSYVGQLVFPTIPSE